jgi:hypothetical protein
MKLSANSILLANCLVALLGVTNAQASTKGSIAVFYQGSDAVDIVGYGSCIPLTQKGSQEKVDFAILGAAGTCNLYKANDCSGGAVGEATKFPENGEASSDYLAAVGPSGSLQCA